MTVTNTHRPEPILSKLTGPLCRPSRGFALSIMTARR